MRNCVKRIQRIYAHIKPILHVNSFFNTIFFNFRYLPIKQAIKLPIFLYKPEIQYMRRGNIEIKASKMYPGLIRLGFRGGRAFPNNGIILSIKGKTVFYGKCQIGNNSAIIVGKQGSCVFGNDFLAPSSIKIFALCGVEFGEKTIFGWDSIIQDTNFHPLFDINSKTKKQGYGKIVIGDDNWFSQGCLVLHSVKTPPRCIFAARSIVSGSKVFESYCVHGGFPLQVIKRNVYLDYDHYMFTDYSVIE